MSSRKATAAAAKAKKDKTDQKASVSDEQAPNGSATLDATSQTKTTVDDPCANDIIFVTFIPYCLSLSFHRHRRY